MSQSHPHRTWLQRTNHSQMNLPNSGSDSAEEKTKSLACDDSTKAQLPLCTHPLRTSLTYQLDSQSLWPLLGVQGRAVLEAFGNASLNLQQGERTSVWGYAKIWLGDHFGHLPNFARDFCTKPSDGVRQIFWGLKVKSKLIEGQRTCQGCRGRWGVSNPYMVPYQVFLPNPFLCPS